jgi:hypothetical protein
VSDSILHHLTDRVAKRATEPADDADAVDDLGAFGWLRGVRERALYLELRRKDGSVHAIGYPWLESITFNPSEGMTLKFTGQTVKIRGRNLTEPAKENVMLLNGILRHKVPWIQEASRSIATWTDKRATVIESIDIARG